MGKYIKLVNGMLKEALPLVESAGAANANEIVSTGTDGKLHISVMPAGTGRDVKTFIPSEILVAGDQINIFSDGAVKVRKADASSNAKPAHGFVINNAAVGVAVSVYFEGINNQFSGLTIGQEYYLSTAGTVSATPPTTAGYISQKIGVAVSTTEIQWDKGIPVEIA